MYSVESFNLSYNIDLPEVMYKVDPLYNQVKSSNDNSICSQFEPPWPEMNRADLEEILKSQEDVISKLNLIEEKISQMSLKLNLNDVKFKKELFFDLANKTMETSCNQTSLNHQVNVIRSNISDEFVIHADCHHVPKVIFNLIYYISKHYGLKTNIRVHLHSSLLTKDLNTFSEWKVLETKNNNMNKFDFDLNVVFIVRTFDENQSWINHQPYLVLNQSCESYLFGNIAIVRYLIRSLKKICPDLEKLYPEKDKTKLLELQAIDNKLNKLQEYFFSAEKNYQLDELLEMIEIQEDKLSLSSNENSSLTLDQVILLTFKK